MIILFCHCWCLVCFLGELSDLPPLGPQDALLQIDRLKGLLEESAEWDALGGGGGAADGGPAASSLPSSEAPGGARGAEASGISATGAGLGAGTLTRAAPSTASAAAIIVARYRQQLVEEQAR